MKKQIKKVRDLLEILNRLPADMDLLVGERIKFNQGFELFDIGVSADPKGDPNLDNCLIILTRKNIILLSE